MKKNRKQLIVDFILNQIGFDISPHIVERHSKRTYLNLEWDEIPENVKRNIVRLGSLYKKLYRLESNGDLGMALFYEKDLK
jgi:hypothetical protein